MKVLEIKHEDGTIWHVPAKVVAFERADHYVGAESTGGEVYDTYVQEEMEAALENERELRDWAANNMLWPELKEHAEKVDQDMPPRVMSTADLAVREVGEA